MEMGELENANEETRIALELDPLSAALAGNLAYGYARAGKDSMADEQLSKLRELDTTHIFADIMTALVCESRGDFKGAIEHVENAIRRRPDRVWYTAVLGFYLAKNGETARAIEILEKLTALPEGLEEKAFDLFWIYAGLGKLDDMFKQLDLAFENRTILFRALRYSNIGPAIRNDPRYAALFERANLRP